MRAEVGGVRRRRQAQEGARVMFEDAAGRILKREMQDVGAQAKKLLKTDEGLEEFETWLERFYLEFGEVARRQMAAAMRAYALTVTDAVDQEMVELSRQASAAGVAGPGEIERDRLASFVESYILQFGTRHSTRSLSWLLAALLKEKEKKALMAEYSFLGAVTDELSAWQEWRAAGVAVEESVRESNAVALAGYQLAGIVRLRSVAFGENCPYCRHLNGKVIGIEEHFLEGGASFMPEGATTPLIVSSSKRHAPYHKGCDCMTVASL